MNRIDQIFADLRSRNGKALMPFICGGHPSPTSTRELLPAIDKVGASIIEVGIPFSDPIADGPVIAAAMHDAIERGSTPRSVFDEVAAVRPTVRAGLVAMCSISIVHRMGGPVEFVSQGKRAGFDGLIVPDTPLEESGPILDAAKNAGLTVSLLIAPTTPPRRAEAIAKASTGFVYLLARAGITGERDEAPDIAGKVGKLREMTDLPIAVGFGISNAEHVREVVRHADAAIVGSAIVRRITEAAARGASIPSEAGAFVAELASGLRPRSAAESDGRVPAVRDLPNI